MFIMALGFLTIFVPLQIFLGDQHGLNTLEHQPAKLAAIEGLWETSSPAPLTLFAIPNQKEERNDYAIEVPVLGSLLLTHSATGEVRGLKEWPTDQRPPVGVVFFAFRIMVGIGFLMFGVIIVGWFLAYRRRIYETQWYLRLCQWMIPAGFIAVLAGWTVTEVGRQPWTIYGLMRTAHSVSPSLTGNDVFLSLVAYMAVYLIMYPAGFAVMLQMVRNGSNNEKDNQPMVALQHSAAFDTQQE